MDISGFNPGSLYALRSPTQPVAADAAFGAGASKRPVENSAQSSTRRQDTPPGTKPTPWPALASSAGSSSPSSGLKPADEAQSEEDKPTQPGATNANGEPLTKEQESQVRELKKRDAEVKAHEQAHAAVGGAYASAPKYTYTKGPDGKKYAVGGEVQIDTSPERTPDATIRKMDIVIAAALAPAEPSSQDRAVARQAQQQRLEAQNELAAQQKAERQERTGQADDATDPRDAGDSTGLGNGVLAQIIAQAEGSARGEGEEDGAFSAQAAASAAYDQAANLAAQIFSGASG